MRQLERFKDIHFVVATNEIERDFRNWFALTYSGIVPKHVDIPTLDIREVPPSSYLAVCFARDLDHDTKTDPAVFL